MSEASYMLAPGETNDSLALRRKIALALAQKNINAPPIEHWAQGLSHLADSAYSGYEINRLSREDRDETARGNAMLAGLFTGGAPQQPAAPAADMSEPRGLRNNNPLNIEAGGFTQSQPGFTGSDGRFAKFASLDQGVGAADKLLQTYATKHGLNTPAGIVGRWAPASDGNPVNNYASSVAKALGSAPDAPVDMANPDVRQKIIAAMAQFENGKPLPAAQPQQMAQAPGINRDAVVQMLGNRKTAPMAQKIIADHIAQQFKPQNTDDIKEYEYAKRNGFQGSLGDWMGIKRGGAGEYGLQPIWGVDAEGKPAITQLGKGGKAVQSQLPPGFQIARDPIKIDGGDRWILLDPQTRQPVGSQSKNIEAKEAAEERGKATGQAQVNLDPVLAKSQLALDTIEKVRTHPGRSMATGAVLGQIPGVPGTTGRGFVALTNQLKGQVFLEAFESLRGGGAITEMEGTKAEQAKARLDRAQNEADFESALNDLRDVIKSGMERAKGRARGISAPAAAASTSAPSKPNDPLGLR